MKQLRKLSLTVLVVALCAVLSVSVFSVYALDSTRAASPTLEDYGVMMERGGPGGYGELAITTDDILTSYPIGEWVSVGDLPMDGMMDTLTLLTRLVNAPDDLHGSSATAARSGAPLSATPATGDSNLDLVVLTLASILIAGSLLVVYSRKRAKSKG